MKDNFFTIEKTPKTKQRRKVDEKRKKQTHRKENQMKNLFFLA